jgi:flagellar motility protein MotE (MotC chaperone)
MKPAKIGAVLAAMEPARAQDLTVLLARRLKVTQGGVVNGAGEVASSSGPNG